MQLNKHPSVKEYDNILPLVNIVFLLLIFFMLAGAFSKPDLFKVDLPIAVNENAADRKVLTVLMDSDGLIALDKSVIHIDELKNIVANEVEKGSLVHLQLKADASMEATKFIDVMEELNDTGLQVLHLLTITADSS